MHRCKSLLLLFPALLFMGSFAMAAEAVSPPPLQPLNFEARYDGTFTGVKLGRLRIDMKEDKESYELKLDTKLSGLARVFSEMRSFAQARGIKKGQTYLPQFYESTEEKNGDPKAREAWIKYDEKAAIAERFRNPMDDPYWRPIVPIADANTGVDPISAYMLLRPKLQQILDKPGQQTFVRTYDGARLAEMNFRVVGRTSIEIMDKKMPVVDTTLTRALLDGYTPKEKRKFKEGDPEIHIYFSDDARLLPVKATIALPAGSFHIALAELKQKSAPLNTAKSDRR